MKLMGVEVQLHSFVISVQVALSGLPQTENHCSVTQRSAVIAWTYAHIRTSKFMDTQV